jgi:HlyD family secretion protein
MRMSRTQIQRLIIIVAAIGAAVAVVRVVLNSRTAKAKGPEIRTAKVERGDVVSSVSATGVIQALTTVDVKSNVGGQVLVLTVDVGSRVHKGDLIAKIDPTDTESAYKQAKADYDSAVAKKVQAKTNIGLQRDADKAAIKQAQQQLASAKAKELQALKQFKVQPDLTQSAIREAQENYNSAMDDCNQLQVATIPQAKAQAKASYDQAMADRETYRKSLDRQKALLTKGYVPQSDVDDADQKYMNAEAAVNTAYARLKTVDGQYKAALEAAKAKCEQAHAQLAAAQQNQVEDEIKRQDWEAAKAAVEQAQAALNLAYANQGQEDVKLKDYLAAEAAFKKTEVALNTATTKLGYVTIRAPRDGVVLTKYIEQGTIIAAGQSSITQGTNIINIGDTSHMFVVCNVDETDIGGIEPGQHVDIKVDAYPNELFEGKVVRVDPQATVNQNVTTIAVKVEITDPDERLKPTMDADCDFITAKHENVMVVPNEALHESDGSYTVTVVQNGKQVQRQVDVGLAGADTTEIRDGLKEGEEVVTQIIQPETTTSGQQQMNSPFNPLQNRFRPRQPGGGAGGARGGGGGGRGG